MCCSQNLSIMELLYLINNCVFVLKIMFVSLTFCTHKHTPYE